MAKKFLVIGLGRFGSALAAGLNKNGCDVLAVDTDMQRVEEFKEQVDFAAELDASDPVALASIDASTCDVAIVAIGENFQAAVLIVSALKDAGVKHILARARNARHARILRAVGADETLEVEDAIGHQLADQLAKPKK